MKKYRNINRRLVLVYCLLVHVVMSYAQENSLLRKGNQQFKNKNYSAAEQAYAEGNESTFSLLYNKGNAQYKQQKYEEAAQTFEKALTKTKDPKSLSETWYNHGNAQFKNNKFQEAITSYKNAIKYNTKDEEAIKNMLLAKKKLKTQQQQQQQQNNSQQNKGQENKDQKEQDQNQQDQNGDNKNQPNQNQNGGDNSDEKNNSKTPQQNTPSQSGEPTNSPQREEIEQALQYIEKEDQKVQGKLRRGAAQRSKNEKDW
jgi:Ca-activated chloride channel homolog